MRPVSPRRVPVWVTDFYTNDPHGQRLAIERYCKPVTTYAERMAAQAFVPERANLTGCTSCGRFSFVVPTLCYWCVRRAHNE